MEIDLQQILETYRETKSQTLTAKKLGLSLWQVHTRLHQAGEPIHKRTHYTGVPRKYDHDQIVEAYSRLGTHESVAAELGCTPSLVGLVLRGRGIHVGIGGKSRNPNVDTEEVIRRYLAGESTIQIGRSLGVDPELVRHRIKRKGVSRRRPGGWGLTGTRHMDRGRIGNR